MEPESSAVAFEVRHIQRLSVRSERDRTGTYFAEGIRQVFRALDEQRSIERLIYCERLAPAFVQKRVREAKRYGVLVERVSPETFRSLSTTVKASGVAALVRQHWTEIDAVDPRTGLCWVAVGALRSPGNLGTIFRTAQAVGVPGIIMLGAEPDPFDPRVVRASMGSVFGLDVVRTNGIDLFLWARRYGCRIVGTSPLGSVAYTEIPVDRPTIFLFGEERQGLKDEELSLCSETISLPMAGSLDSINVGVAAGVILYDMWRRRGGVSESLVGKPCQ